MEYLLLEKFFKKKRDQEKFQTTHFPTKTATKENRSQSFLCKRSFFDSGASRTSKCDKDVKQLLPSFTIQLIGQIYEPINQVDFPQRILCNFHFVMIDTIQKKYTTSSQFDLYFLHYVLK